MIGWCIVAFLGGALFRVAAGYELKGVTSGKR